MVEMVFWGRTMEGQIVSFPVQVEYGDNDAYKVGRKVVRYLMNNIKKVQYYKVWSADFKYIYRIEHMVDKVEYHTHTHNWSIEWIGLWQGSRAVGDIRFGHTVPRVAL